jgi:uncharacterized protein (DUF433 family)
VLRKRYNVPLQELRRVGTWLTERHAEPWSSLRFALLQRRVVFFEPNTGDIVEPRGHGQEVLPIALEPIANEMRDAAAQLRERSAEQLGQLARNRYVVHNAWVIAGTRIPTTAIWNFHSAGYSDEAIVAEFPRLTVKDVRAAIDFEANRGRVA